MSKSSNSLSQLALQRFKKNFWGVFSFWFIAGCFVLAIFAYLIAPDHSANANQMHLSIHSKAPGFKVSMLTIPNQLKSKKESWLQSVFFGEQFSDTEIPINDYSFTKEDLLVTTYHEGALVGLEKSYHLAEIFPRELSSTEIEKKYIQKVLNTTNNNKTKAAEILGITRKTLSQKLDN